MREEAARLAGEEEARVRKEREEVVRKQRQEEVESKRKEKVPKFSNVLFFSSTIEIKKKNPKRPLRTKSLDDCEV